MIIGSIYKKDRNSQQQPNLSTYSILFRN